MMIETNYIKSPMNYIGNKYRIIGQIKQWFPDNINTMVDLICFVVVVMSRLTQKQKNITPTTLTIM